MAAGVQLIGTVVGGALGGPVGAAIGGAIGGVLGAALFPPPPIRGPRAEDIRFNGSNIGAPIKRLYGSGRTAPTLIWFGEREDVERSRKEGGMFGIGGQKVIEYEYYVTCAFALGEPGNPAGVDVRRIWANGELIYSQNELSAAQLEQLQEYLRLRQIGLERGIWGVSDPSGFIGSSAAAQKFETEVLTIYRGVEDQEPDPTIQSYVGVDDTPAFKGVAYFLFKRWDITRWGGALPNIEVEYVNGPSTGINAPEWRNEVLSPWVNTGSTDPRACENDHEYRYAPIPTAWGPLEDAIAAAQTGIGYPLSPYMLGWKISGNNLISPYDGVDPGERKTLVLVYNHEIMNKVADRYGEIVVDGGDADGFTQLHSVGVVEDTYIWWTGHEYSGISGVHYISSDGVDGAPPEPAGKWVSLNHCVPAMGCPYTESGTPFWTLYRLADIKFEVRRVPKCPPSPCASCAGSFPLLPEDDRYCVNPETGEILFAAPYLRYDSGSVFAILVDYTTLADYVSYYEEPAIPAGDERFPDALFEDETARDYWERIHLDAGQRGILPAGWEDQVYGVDYPVVVESPNFKVLAQYSAEGTFVDQYPLGPCVPEWSQSYSDAGFWTAQYNAQREKYLLTGASQDYIPAGWSYGTSYPTVQTWSCARFPPAMKYKQAYPITVQEIVEDLSAECGLLPQQIDATALTKTLWGYERNAVMSGRDAIEQLRTYAFFDACEADLQIRFVVRGGAAVATLSADDLGAHADGESAPPAIVPSRVNDVELMREVLVNYLDVDSKYQGNTQRAGRSVVGEQGRMNLSLAIVAEAAQIKGVANAVLYDQWAARNSYETSVLREWMALEPTDPILVPVDLQMVRMRIAQIDQDPRGVRKIKAVREEATVYTNAPDDGGIGFPVPDEVHPTIGPTLLTVIDGPAIDGAGNDAGVYVAARGMLAGWSGARIYMSNDGAVYDAAVSITDPAALGSVTNAATSGPFVLWDRATVLEVSLPSAFELLSATDEQVLGGANQFFFGDAGRWELAAFATASLVSDEAGVRTYALSDLLRGLQGTEWAIGLHAEGESFVLASTLIRLTLTDGVLGSALSIKAVSSGTSIDGVAAQEFVPAGVALKPFAPWKIRSVRDAGGDILIEWQRRTRISGEWIANADVPLNEDGESYEVDVLSSGAVVRTLQSTTRTVVYSADEIAADFGSTPDQISVQVYQISARVGRGYPGSGVV